MAPTDDRALAITVNGDARRITAGTTVADFLGEYDLDPEVVVVERNGTILPRDRFATTSIEPDDRLEIVHLVGGG